MPQCNPKCVFFRCKIRALYLRGGIAYCKMDNNPCIGGKCQYAICKKHALSKTGECLLQKRRKYEKIELNDDIFNVPVEIDEKSKKWLEDLEL